MKYIQLLILCGLISSCSTSVSTRGLVAYYPFTGNANDKSGNNYDGQVVGPILDSDRNNNKNSAYLFDGIDDYIYIADAENLRITDQITMSVWFKTDYALPFAGIICKAEPSEPQHGYIIGINDYNKARADVIYDHSKGIGGIIHSNKILVDGKWHHVLATYNGEELDLYVDGELNQKIIYKEKLQSNTEPLLIGWDPCTWLSHRHFKGLIDDIRIFNRALSKREIVNIYREKN